MKVVLSGSGMRYPAHVGALKAIIDSGIDITEIAGVSGGAIVAAAYASGWGFDDEFKSLEALVEDTLPGPNNLIDKSYWPFSAPYGVIKGVKLLKQFEKVLVPTMEKTHIPLYILTTDLETGGGFIWSSDKHPKVSVPLLVRASISIPIVFEYVMLGWKIHVDGGVANNFPVDLFEPLSDVIGIKIVTKKTNKRFKIDSFTSYLSAVINSMLSAQEREHEEDAVHARIIRIETDTDSLGFEIDEKGAQKLMLSAYNQTLLQLKEKGLVKSFF